MRIDAHQHFWSVARGDYGWLQPGNDLYRDFLPADLAPELASGGIQRTVLVQAAPTVAETDFMLQLAERNHFVAGVVGWIDFEDPSHERHLRRLAEHDKFLGVRPMIQAIPADGWMLQDSLSWAYRALIDSNLTFDALCLPRHLPHLYELCSRYPSLRIVIDHCAKPNIREQEFDVWARDIERIARDTAAMCKLSGLVTEARADWNVDELRPYVRHVLEVFGPARVMWGSDWPVCLLASSYQRWRETAESLLETPDAREQVFGATAARFYNLK